MKNNKREIVFMALGVLFLIVVLVSAGVFKNLGEKVAEDFYVNAQGQKWALPTEGTYEFTASSGSYPKFLSGKIEPLKVKVGDTQTMAIRVASPVPLKGVTAFIETDTKTVEVSLTLTANKALSGDYFESQPYLINENKELIINQSGSSYAKDALKQIVSSAEAQSLVEYTFEGSWVVNDTHTKTYHTKFVAEAENGDKNQMTLAWSDPICEFNPSGELINLSGACTFGNSVEGFDGGSVNVPSSFTLTINSGGTFVWNGNADNKNRSLTIGNGANIILSGGGQIKEGILYFDPDSDDDTWPANTEFHYGDDITGCDGCLAPIRVSDSPARPWATLPEGSDGSDCLDSNVNVKPGQTLYFKDSYDPGGEAAPSYDYDCSGASEGGWGSNEPVASSTNTIFFDTISGSYDDQLGGPQACIVGETIADFSLYCGTTSPTSLVSCNVDLISEPPTGGRGVFPEEINNGWMYGNCTACIGTSVAGFCR